MGGSGTRVYRNIAQAAGYTIFGGHALMLRSGDKIHDNYLLREHFYDRWVDRYLAGDAAGLAGVRMRLELRALLFASDPLHYGRGAWGFKNPRAIYLLPLFKEMWPGLRFIQVVRDGRDHAFHPRHQYLGHQQFLISEEESRLDNHVRKALIWARTNERAERFAERELPNAYLRSNLEVLISDPEVEIRRIFAFLGGAPDDEVARLAQYVETPSTLGRWRDADPAEVAAVDATIGETLVRYGYPLAGSGASAASDAAAGAHASRAGESNR